MKTPQRAMARRLLLCAAALLVSVFLPSLAFAQQSKDEREAAQIAREFSRRLRRTRDAGPLIRTFFVDDFLERNLQGLNGEHFLLIKNDVALKSRRDEVRRYYVAWLNWLYLTDVYLVSRYSQEEIRESTPEKIFPRRLWNLMTSEPATAVFFKSDPPSSEVALISSNAQLRKVTKIYEHANTLLRRYVRSFKHYREAPGDRDERPILFKPWTSTCDENCYGLPANSNIIFVNVPSFQMNLIRIKGQMKIVLLMLYVD